MARKFTLMFSHLGDLSPEPRPEADGLPANTTAAAPTLITLAPAIGSVEASRFGHENFGNRAAVWPGRVSSTGFDEFSYLETTITPGPGASFSVADFVIPQFNVYSTDDGGSWQAAIRSSLDNFSEDLSTTSGAGTYRIQFNLAGEPSMRNLTTPLTFRVYLWETALVEGTAFNPQMWFDIAGNALGTAPGIQILGEAQLGSIGNPSIATALYVEGTGFQIEAIDLTPGSTYDIAVAFDLSEEFTPLQLEQTATSTTLTFVDGFADASLDTKAFYRIQEVVPR